MIEVRNVFLAKYGKGDELVALLKEARDSWEEYTDMRILTDISGTFFTVVMEVEVESLKAHEERNSEMFSDPEFGKWFARMEPLIKSGHREFYRIE